MNYWWALVLVGALGYYSAQRLFVGLLNRGTFRFFLHPVCLAVDHQYEWSAEWLAGDYTTAASFTCRRCQHHASVRYEWHDDGPGRNWAQP